VSRSRALFWLGFGLLAAGCAHERAQTMQARVHPPCDPASSLIVRHRTDGPMVRLELHQTTLSCDEAPVETVTPLAQITLPPPTSSCPVGQVGLRSLGQGFEEPLKPFLSSLTEESRAELSQALQSFAEAADAFVVACPTRGRADWLLVETTPHTARPRLQLFVRERLSPDRRHPAVHFE
jgi:hypothetical protein